MSNKKTPRQRLIAHTVDHLVENRKAAAEELGMSQMGLRYLDPDDPDGDALHIQEAIEEVGSGDGRVAQTVNKYLGEEANARTLRRLVCAIARRFNERLDTKRRARIARLRQRTR
jgi:hypothetical protein